MILGLCWCVGCVCAEGKNPAGSIPLAPPTTPFQRCFGSFVFPHVDSIIPVIRQTLVWQQANPYHTAYRAPLNRSSWCIEIATGWPTCPLRGANQRSVVSVNAFAVSVLDTRPVADLWALTQKKRKTSISYTTCNLHWRKLQLRIWMILRLAFLRDFILNVVFNLPS